MKKERREAEAAAAGMSFTAYEKKRKADRQAEK
jgi:hypothetical protein